LLLITQQWETVFHSDFAQHKTALGKSVAPCLRNSR
jgi:hypothetical protein